MAGIAMLIALIIYGWLGVFMVRLAWRKLNVVLAILIAILFVGMPFVDAIAGRMWLKQKCETDARIIVFRSISGVDGIYTRYGPFINSPIYYGYQFVEGGEPTGSISRSIKMGGMEATMEKNVESKSLYELLDEPRQDSYWFYSVKSVVRVRKTGEELANFTWYSFRGGWAERFAMMLSDAGPGAVAECGNYENRHKKIIELLHTALKPAPEK